MLAEHHACVCLVSMDVVGNVSKAGWQWKLKKVGVRPQFVETTHVCCSAVAFEIWCSCLGFPHKYMANE